MPIFVILLNVRRKRLKFQQDCMAKIKRVYTAVIKTPSQAMIYALIHTVIHEYTVDLL